VDFVIIPIHFKNSGLFREIFDITMEINRGKLLFPLIIMGLIFGLVGNSAVYADRDSSSAPVEQVYEDVDGDEFKYKGSLKDNQPHGPGMGSYTNGNKYVGEYKNGKKHGQGVYTWANGDKYAGEFSGGMEHGEGTYTWAEGNKYVGKFKENNPIGGWIYWPAGGKAWSYKDSKGNWIYK